MVGHNARHMPMSPPDRYCRNLSPLALLAVTAWVAAGCGPLAEPEQPAEAGCGGFLRASLHGGIAADIDWQGAELDCEGMPRPADDGVRLRFAGTISDAGRSRKVAIILGIEGLSRAGAGRELATNVTLIEEGEGRFFGTRDMNDCWSDVTNQGPAVENRASLSVLDGTVYCVSPLAELNGVSTISFTEMTFSGVVDWEPAE